MKTLIIIGHDNFEKSRINKVLAQHITDIPDVTVHKLSSDLDIALEQQLLLEHDRIILQFPVQWYSTPVILKKWIDNVLAWGFAYGDQYKLEGKKLKLVVSTGGSKEAYSSGGQNGHSLEEFLLPILATARYVKFDVEPIFAIQDVFQLNDDELQLAGMHYRSILTN